MSRDEILSKLWSFGAISIVLAIQEVEAGRVRRVSIPTIPGDPSFSREVLGFLRSLGAEVDFAAKGAGSYRLRSLSG